MARLGLTPHHRRSFSPVRQLLSLPLFPDVTIVPDFDETDENQWN
jgi:hypothetical protein